MEFAVRRDHRKLLVIDGTTAFVGGINIHAEAAPRSEGGGGWHDFAIRVRGPGVRHILDLFAETWHHIRPRPKQRLGAEIDGSSRELAGPVTLRIIGSDDVRGRWEIRRSLLYAIRRARRSVFIANAYFVPDVGVVRTLKATARRGVRVSILLPWRSDIPIVDYASGAVFDQLLRSGVELYHWTDSVLHAKVAVVDGAWSMVGSYNLDWFSLLRNREVVVNVLDEPFGQSLAHILEGDIESSHRLSIESWRDRPLWRRWLAEPTAYAFRRYL
jgi:cardiolipin synthase A/B